MTQAEHPVHRPEVTTSVKSSAHCGFSGGIGPPYSAAGHRSGTVGSGARNLGGRAVPRPGREGALAHHRQGLDGRLPLRTGRDDDPPAPERAGRARLHRGPATGQAPAPRHRWRSDPGYSLRDDRRPGGRRRARRSTGCSTGRGCSATSGSGPASPSPTGAISSSMTPAVSARWSWRPTRAAWVPTRSPLTLAQLGPRWPATAARATVGAAQGPAVGSGAGGRDREPAGRRDPVAGRAGSRATDPPQR